MKVFAGTSGYAYREWRGKFYPEKIPPKEMLRFYSQRLPAVEINNTFYQMPREGVLSSWAEQVPDDFVFALKAPQVITHLKRLRNVSAETGYLFRSLKVLDKKLGPVLFQFPKSFHADSQALKDFLALIPGDISCAFEFRSPSWLGVEILICSVKRGAACASRIRMRTRQMRLSIRRRGGICACGVPAIRMQTCHNGRRGSFRRNGRGLSFFLNMRKRP